ncbi:MAG TPA: hypothetical protein VMY39_00685 [Planctomycetota bacterium]|nr:hypothetical protein [Planctomycetota bacterium]HUV38092.1 hypothetical protein [Planctomycetota bacterium]
MAKTSRPNVVFILTDDQGPWAAKDARMRCAAVFDFVNLQSFTPSSEDTTWPSA